VNSNKQSTYDLQPALQQEQQHQQQNTKKRSSIEDVLERTKAEIFKKLNDLRTSAMRVQLEIEHDSALDFDVKQKRNAFTNDLIPVEFTSARDNNNNDRQSIYFNTDKIVDLLIAVRNRDPAEANYEEEQLNAHLDGKFLLIFK
jgi:hypothetical protein